MRNALVVLAVVAAAFILTADPAGAAGPTILCGVTTTGLPGGTVNHRLALTNFWTDPQTTITGYAVWGYNVTTTADSWGYGHTSPGATVFPITISFTDGPTAASSMIRQWRFDVQSNLTANVRITDSNTNGTFTATAVANMQCNFIP